MNFNREFSDEELFMIARKHSKHLRTIKSWKKFREEDGGEQLPHHCTFIARFGTWNQFKARLSLDLNGQHAPLHRLEKHSPTYVSQLSGSH